MTFAIASRDRRAFPHARCTTRVHNQALMAMLIVLHRKSRCPPIRGRGDGNEQQLAHSAEHDSASGKGSGDLWILPFLHTTEDSVQTKWLQSRYYFAIMLL